MARVISVSEACARVPLLAKLHPQELDALRPVMQTAAAPRGRLVVKQGDHDRSLYFIAEGTLKACLANQDGKEVILAMLQAGEYFGEIALLAETPRTNDVVALSDCMLLILTHRAFIEHLRAHRGLSLLLLQSLALRLRDSALRVADLALLDVCGRVGRTLFNLSVAGEYDGQAAHIVRERPTHQALAGMVGATREAVTRALKALEEDGHLMVDGDTVVIRSLPRI